MRLPSLILVIVSLLGSSLTPVVGGAAEPRRLAFMRGDEVWIASIDGTAPSKIGRGQMPELSPDGTRLAYNTVQPIGQPAHRQIAIVGLASRTTTILDKIPSDNVMTPRWSPDGARLLVDYYANNERRIGVIGADGSGFRDVLGAQQKNYWAATWAADGESIFVEDMEFVYRLGLDGTVRKKWRIDQIVPHGGMGGDIRMAAAPDGKTLLMDVEMAERERGGWDGPPPSIWVFDLTAETSRRLTPPTLYAWDCAWLDAPDSILFISQARGEQSPSIYRMTANGQGKDRRLLVRNARNPSTSR